MKSISILISTYLIKGLNADTILTIGMVVADISVHTFKKMGRTWEPFSFLRDVAR